MLKPPVSLGVRLIVRDPAGTILLVRHTYTAGWHLPGGGVDVGETAQEAAVRECREETGYVPDGALRLVGVHFNRGYSNRDHVVTYAVDVVDDLNSFPLRAQALEIAEVVAAPIAGLPDGTTASTMRRLAEAFESVPTSTDW
ncbi:NUDIX domain-containing protein [Acuticoccus sediminis]|uniref:NUDIX domain-containing protein n=1 Tax=Acuticoccus sediminis TaxID=2184697 RepID=UPI001CFE7335|nr:NUDIX domain-containing protein [Acuticoccus sediminis]